jgi:flagellum-specific peptidoglycan hydrolase FlgJ
MSQAKDFIEKYKQYAIDVMEKTGVPASVTMAQAALESGWGGHAPGFNFFGIKGTGPAGSQILVTHENLHGKTVVVPQKFRKYHSALEAFEDHATILINGPLKAVMNHTKSAQDFVTNLQAGQFKYATDPGYVDKIMAIIQTHNLEELDDD